MLATVVVAVLLAPPVAAEVPVITPEQAKDHVGQEVVVEGQVTQIGVSDSGDALFLNFGGRYPSQVFNAVILRRNFQFLPDARSWEGKTVRVRGKIELYRGTGKPEIILERPEQVTVDSSTAPPEGGVPQGMEGGVEGGIVRGVPGGVLGGDLGGTGTGPVMNYDSPPRPIKITRPQYPKDAFRKKVEGTVIVEILIDETGRVARARVIQSVPLLDAAALQTVYQWAFQPAIKGGRPVPTIAHAPVAFRIMKKASEEPEQRKQSPMPTGEAGKAPSDSPKKEPDQATPPPAQP